MPMWIVLTELVFNNNISPVASVALILCVSLGRAAAAALHDQVRLRGGGRPSGSAAGVTEHQRAETQSEEPLLHRHPTKVVLHKITIYQMAEY